MVKEVSNNTSSESGDSSKRAYSAVESSPDEDIDNQSTTSFVSLGRQIPEKMTRDVTVPLPSAMVFLFPYPQLVVTNVHSLRSF